MYGTRSYTYSYPDAYSDTHTNAHPDDPLAGFDREVAEGEKEFCPPGLKLNRLAEHDSEGLPGIAR